MNVYDLKSVFESGHGDWFTAHLLRLIAKADFCNKAKLAVVFPVEVRAVDIYQHDTPYKEDGSIDWDKIVEMAQV